MGETLLQVFSVGAESDLGLRLLRAPVALMADAVSVVVFCSPKSSLIPAAAASLAGRHAQSGFVCCVLARGRRRWPRSTFLFLAGIFASSTCVVDAALENLRVTFSLSSEKEGSLSLSLSIQPIFYFIFSFFKKRRGKIVDRPLAAR